MLFQYRDERVKILAYIIAIMIINGIVFVCIYNFLLNDINNKIINQNGAIISKLAKEDSYNVKEIIPIITGKEELSENDIVEGKEILAKYSYDNKLSYINNPLLRNINKKGIFIIWGVILLTLLIVIVGILKLINPLFKEVNYLSYRAENIIENKQIKRQREHIYKGSLDKFIMKFAMMEERIYNNITLLYEEKVNLKNIINDISHQLKTPLMALTMYNEIIEDHSEMNNEEIDNFIKLSKEQLERMEWLVKTLLKYARLECNVVEYKKKETLINTTIEESVKPLKIKAKEKEQELIYTNLKNEVYLYHDEKWIAEAISNIVKNAIEHTGIGGKIEIGIEETPITLTVWIKDNGEGIKKSELKKIFNRFHKGENSINPTSIGIGLCLSKAIVKEHNGDIMVESEEGKGSKFSLTFIK